MPIICNCRAVSGIKLENFLKNRAGDRVSLKDVLNECGSGTGECCGNNKECMGGIKELVDMHNDGKSVDQAIIKQVTDEANQKTAERLNKKSFFPVQPA